MTDYESKLFDSSRNLADMLMNDIGADPEKFSQMFALAMRDTYPLSMRAARVMQLCTEKYPSLLLPHVDTVIQALPLLKVEGVRRSYLRMLNDVVKQIDEEQIGLVTDMCFRWIKDMKQAIAVRVYSLDMLVQVIGLFPDLRFELIEILETLEKTEDGAMLGRCRLILGKMRKWNASRTGKQE